MNILLLSWRAPKHPNAGGAEIVTLEHAKGWVEKGHSVTWFSSVFKGCKSEEEIEGIHIIRRGRQIIHVQIKAFFWYLFKRHHKFDLVIDQFHGIPFFTPLYVRTRKLAFIHEVAKEVWGLNPWPKPFSYFPRFFGKVFEPFIFKILYRKIPFLTVSESTRTDLEKWGIPKANITVIHNGVRTPKILEIQKDSRFTATYLGSISLDKGIFDAVKAFAEIERKAEDWQYWIVGQGSKHMVDRIKSMAKELGIAHKLKIWGYVNDSNKYRILSKSHVLINPSIREGWGLTNIEASSVGTPVLGYDVPGLRDSVKNGKTGLLVTLGNYKELAENAIKITRDKDLYLRMKNESQKWAKRFSWEEARWKSLDLIESI